MQDENNTKVKRPVGRPRKNVDTAEKITDKKITNSDSNAETKPKRGRPKKVVVDDLTSEVV